MPLPDKPAPADALSAESARKVFDAISGVFWSARLGYGDRWEGEAEQWLDRGISADELAAEIEATPAKALVGVRSPVLLVRKAGERVLRQRIIKRRAEAGERSGQWNAEVAAALLKFWRERDQRSRRFLKGVPDAEFARCALHPMWQVREAAERGLASRRRREKGEHLRQTGRISPQEPPNVAVCSQREAGAR